MKNQFILWIVMAFMSLLPPLTGFAQKEDRLWVVPNSAGIDFNDLENPVSFTSKAYAGEPIACISDSAGNLLFYTSYQGDEQQAQGDTGSCTLYNRYGNVLENGDKLNSYLSATNGAVIIPIPKTKQYYLFSIGIGPNYISLLQRDYRLYWHLIDMEANNGGGKVISKNNEIPIAFEVGERIAAIKAANGKDWWILTTENYGNKVASLYVKPDVIVGAYYQVIDSIRDYSSELAISRKGDAVAFQDRFGFRVYRFNRCTGKFHKTANIIDYDSTESPVYKHKHGCAFSPDGRLFYRAGWGVLHQFDLTADNINLSRKQIAKVYNMNTELGHRIRQIELGPDDKLYVGKIGFPSFFDDGISSPYHLAVIHKPNELGDACNFELNGFYVGPERTHGYLPNMPNYNLGPLAGPYDMGLSWAASTVGTTATFENTTDCSTCSYVWHFGDGATSTAVSPTHTYAATGSYTVQLIATSIYGGCSDTLAQVLTIGTPTGTAVPTAPPIQVYPNPTRERFTVALGAPTPCRLALYSAVGREVYRAQSTAPTHDIDVSTLPEGVYLLQVSTENRSFTKKITVRR